MEERCHSRVWKDKVSPADQSINHHAADGFAFLHQIKGVVDLLKRHGVRDKIVDRDLLLHVPVDDLWHIRTPARAAECGSLPYAAGDELEGSGGDFLSRRRNANAISDCFLNGRY